MCQNLNLFANSQLKMVTNKLWCFTFTAYAQNLRLVINPSPCVSMCVSKAKLRSVAGWWSGENHTKLSNEYGERRSCWEAVITPKALCSKQTRCQASEAHLTLSRHAHGIPCQRVGRKVRAFLNAPGEEVGPASDGQKSCLLWKGCWMTTSLPPDRLLIKSPYRIEVEDREGWYWGRQ